MSYLIFSASLLLVYVGLAQLLHIQFGMLGVPNFGVVGFWGAGMYAVGVLNVQLNVPFVVSLLLSCVLLMGISYLLGSLILRLKGQAMLCATLAFSSIIALLVVTEKWITEGVVGLGTIKYPFKIGGATEFIYFLLLLAIVVSLQFLINKVNGSRLGRLMIAIRDNEELASSLGKDTYKFKLKIFAITCTLMGLLGGMSAPLNQFLTPNMLVPGVTFAVWIALILGGKEHALGAILGVFITFGLFDILIEVYLPVSPEYAVKVPNFKLFLYGALLIGVLMYRPRGLMSKGMSLQSLLGRGTQ